MVKRVVSRWEVEERSLVDVSGVERWETSL